MGKVEWSPAIQKARELLELWGLILKKKIGKRVSSQLITRGMAKFHLAFRIRDITMAQIITSKRDALKEYRSLKLSSSALRTTFLEDLAAARSAAGHNSIATEICQLQTQEHQRSMARRICYIYGTSKGGGVTSVIAPDGTGSYVELTSKSDMECAIMDENERKYRQASQTLFMVPPLLDDFGYLGIGPNAQSVMTGEYAIPPNVDPFTSKFIDQLQMDPAIQQAPPIPVYFTTEEWKDGWRKIKEHTATGSDFMHFGHFKAGCTNDVVANFEATVANIPLLSEYSPKHWKKAVDCMLLKREGDYEVDKL
jgi:hypothetical protein